LVIGFGRTGTGRASTCRTVVLTFERHAKAFFGFGGLGMGAHSGQAQSSTQGQRQGSLCHRVGSDLHEDILEGVV
jgi:hypothetical protein